LNCIQQPFLLVLIVRNFEKMQKHITTFGFQIPASPLFFKLVISLLLSTRKLSSVVLYKSEGAVTSNATVVRFSLTIREKLLSVETPVETALLASLAGIKCYYGNQWHCRLTDNASKLTTVLQGSYFIHSIELYYMA